MRTKSTGQGATPCCADAGVQVTLIVLGLKYSLTLIVLGKILLNGIGRGEGVKLSLLRPPYLSTVIFFLIETLGLSPD